MQRDRLPVVVHPSLWIQIHILTMRPESQGMQSRLQPDSSGRFLIAGRPPRSGWPRSSPSNQARIHISPPRFLRASSALPPRFLRASSALPQRPPRLRVSFLHQSGAVSLITDHRSLGTSSAFPSRPSRLGGSSSLLPSATLPATSAPPRFVPPPARGCFTDH